MSFIDEFDPYSPERYRMCEMNFVRQVYRNISYYNLYMRIFTCNYPWSLSPRARDKDDDRSVIAENPMLHANVMALCFTEPELWVNEVVHCGNRDFRLLCSCDSDLDPMTFIFELDPYSLEMHQVCKYEFPASRLSKAIV